MVKEVEKNGKTYYQCEVCMFYYKDRKTAQECEDFCNKYKSCSIEITGKAVELGE